MIGRDIATKGGREFGEHVQQMRIEEGRSRSRLADRECAYDPVSCHSPIVPENQHATSLRSHMNNLHPVCPTAIWVAEKTSGSNVSCCVAQAREVAFASHPIVTLFSNVSSLTVVATQLRLEVLKYAWRPELLDKRDGNGALGFREGVNPIWRGLIWNRKLFCGIHDLVGHVLQTRVHNHIPHRICP